MFDKVALQLRRLGIAAGLLVFVQFVGAPARSASQDEIVVFAAASLAGALDEVVDVYLEQSGGDVVVSYAATSNLARQVERGAPADIVISADSAWMDYLSDRNLIKRSSRTDLLGNRLVLVAPAVDSPDLAGDLARAVLDLVGPDRRLVMATAESVPAGRYARATLEALGIWAEVARFVVQTDNVRTALSFVALGEAHLGIVYATDAMNEPRVAVIATFSTELHPPIVYPAAIVGGAAAPVGTFFEYLTGPEAAAIFAAHGFIVPQPTDL